MDRHTTTLPVIGHVGPEHAFTLQPGLAPYEKPSTSDRVLAMLHRNQRRILAAGSVVVLALALASCTEQDNDSAPARATTTTSTPNPPLRPGQRLLPREDVLLDVYERTGRAVLQDSGSNTGMEVNCFEEDETRVEPGDSPTRLAERELRGETLHTEKTKLPDGLWVQVKPTDVESESGEVMGIYERVELSADHINRLSFLLSGGIIALNPLPLAADQDTVKTFGVCVASPFAAPDGK